VVIVGTGAAGSAAAEMLRRQGYAGPVTLLGEDPDLPYDRPNLSKDYLAGRASEDWIPLRSREFYQDKRIDVRTSTRVLAIDTKARTLALQGGEKLPFGALLLATGARPRRLPIPGAELDHVLTLRSLGDSRALIARAETARRVVVLGAGFIGLEVAASLRTRGLEVHVVAPDPRPLERIVGQALAEMIKTIHEEHGVRFHLGRKPVRIEADSVALDDGTALPADLVVMGVGVRPRLGLAEKAGLRLDKGVLVDATLRTSAEGIWAAGDIARFPDPQSGRPIRVEHWVVAERQGQHVARAMLGAREPYRAVPFFWTQHYDVPINYVGHAEGWDSIAISGSVGDRNCLVAYRQGGRVQAVASIHRDRESLLIEAAMEGGDEAAVGSLLRA
jgi:NADPH-dependent 2,4-dienoyl-CoA reductase/sulfur reductase-like enzyme